MICDDPDCAFCNSDECPKCGELVEVGQDICDGCGWEVAAGAYIEKGETS